jgi:hypothetical protein
MHEGGCYCGAIRYRIAGEPIHHAICHCRDCQRASGAPAVTWLMLPEAGLSVTQGSCRTVRGRDHAVREFCPDCGTGLFYRNAQNLPCLVDIQSVTLDDPNAFAPQVQIQLADRLSWAATAHDLPGFERFPPPED